MNHLLFSCRLNVCFFGWVQRRLRSQEYDDINNRYRIKRIYYETTLIAAEDVKKYANALDKVRVLCNYPVPEC
jgi:hypothetical protein